MKFPSFLAAIAMITAVPVFAADAAKKHVLLLAGRPSHGPGQHEHNAGVLLLKKCLDESGLPVETKAYLNAEWPEEGEIAAADTILFYCDGGAGHFLLKDDRLAQVEKAMKRGAGFACLHYAVEYPKEKGGPQALDWMGGFFEADWSVNPHWVADYTKLPKHPVSNGVKPFSTNDEWYFHMRFADPAKGARTDILSAIAPDSTMSRKTAHMKAIRRSARRWPRKFPNPPHGPSSARMAAAALVSPAATSTQAGATTSNASSCSTRSSGRQRARSLPTACPAR